MLRFIKGRTQTDHDQESKQAGWFGRLRSGLNRTRSQLGCALDRAILGQKTIDEDLFDIIETQLLMADVGVEATEKIIHELTQRLKRNQLADSQAVLETLKETLKQILSSCEKPLIVEKTDEPYVILMIGVNGNGKTTTIGKLAKRLQNEGKSVLLAAGDTFRAAAVEQLIAWGDRNQIPVISQGTGADSASVVFDAISSAKSKHLDVVIADTAGRLHTQKNLMDELAKVKRVIQKLDQSAPHEVMLVLDAGTGQNALAQVKQFHEALNVTGLTLTKLDGTAKGGIIFAIAEQYQLPIRFIGVGEGIDDLQAFDANEFVDALFDE